MTSQPPGRPRDGAGRLTGDDVFSGRQHLEELRLWATGRVSVGRVVCGEVADEFCHFGRALDVDGVPRVVDDHDPGSGCEIGRAHV